MKKKGLKVVCSSLLILGLSSTAQAALFDRGGLVYDSDQDLTWLKDANYARTSGYDTNGRMSWSNATSWAASLNMSSTIGTNRTWLDPSSEWRLPSVTDIGNDGCTWGNSGTECGYNVDTSGNELAYMFHNILGNLSYRDASGNWQVNYGVTSIGADGVNFQNIQTGNYWSGTEYAPDTYSAWTFQTDAGAQNVGRKFNHFYAWAVRSGDVAPVPLPAAAWFFGAGLAGLGLFGRRKKH